jgi:hypothetical protein
MLCCPWIQIMFLLIVNFMQIYHGLNMKIWRNFYDYTMFFAIKLMDVCGYSLFDIFFLQLWIVATPLWGSCEVATHTLENGTWESSGTPENSECNCRGQNTSPWGVLYTVGKVLKCKCPKWPHMSHLDIYSTVMVERRVGGQTDSLTPDH